MKIKVLPRTHTDYSTGNLVLFTQYWTQHLAEEYELNLLRNNELKNIDRDTPGNEGKDLS